MVYLFKMVIFHGELLVIARWYLHWFMGKPKTYWCVLRREFSGMIPVITSNFIIPATPSNPSIPYVKRTSKRNTATQFTIILVTCLPQLGGRFLWGFEHSLGLFTFLRSLPRPVGSYWFSLGFPYGFFLMVCCLNPYETPHVFCRTY